MSGAAAALRAGVLALVGAALLLAAAALAWRTHGFLARAQSAPGVVTRLLAGPSHPQVRFTTAAGETVETPQGGLIFGYAPGRAVRVRYDPAEPRASARLDDAGALWGPALLLAAIGLALLAAGGLPLLQGSRGAAG